MVHRLVAKTFIHNPDNLQYVNHKDGDKTNNHVDNLEWCTQSENCLHGNQFRSSQKKSEKIENVSGFQDIPGFSKRYMVDPHGRLYGKGRKTLMSAKKHNGYLYLSLKNDEDKKIYTSIHRMVALTFIPNPNNYPMVNHKNGNRSDNRVENLEWVTRSQNMKHALKIAVVTPNNKKIAQINRHTGETVKIYDSIKVTAKALKCHRNVISDIVRGIRKYRFDYTFQYC